MEAGEAFLQSEDACPEQWGNIPSCWVWYSAGAFVGDWTGTMFLMPGWACHPWALALGCISPPPDQHPFLAHRWGCEASFSEEGLVVPGGVRSGLWPAVCFTGTKGGFLNPPILGNYCTNEAIKVNLCNVVSVWWFREDILRFSSHW